MNSREKGKRGERQWRDELRAHGYCARRGQQFAGSAESPDVVCDDLKWIHFEVKAVEKLNIEDAMEQARRDAVKSEGRDPKSEGNPNSETQRVAMVAHRRKFRAWLVTMEAEALFRILRGDFTEFGVRSSEFGVRTERNLTAENRKNAETKPLINANGGKMGNGFNAKTQRENGSNGEREKPLIHADGNGKGKRKRHFNAEGAEDAGGTGTEGPERGKAER